MLFAAVYTLCGFMHTDI